MRNTIISFFNHNEKNDVTSVTQCTNSRIIYVECNPIRIACAAVLSLIFLAIPLNTARADCGPFGGGMDNRYSYCEPNPLNFSKTECRALCENSEYCMLYQDEKRTIFGGYWRYKSSNGYEDGDQYQCQKACTIQKNECDENDNECLARFIPQDTDCTQLTDTADQEYCNQNCINNILTSECGRNCLKNGIENVSIDDGNSGSPENIITSIAGCRNDFPYYCSALCINNYSDSIPMDYKERWSILGILVALLAAMSITVLAVIHRRNNTQSADRNS